jgi:hypothetical protein
LGGGRSRLTRCANNLKIKVTTKKKVEFTIMNPIGGLSKTSVIYQINLLKYLHFILSISDSIQMKCGKDQVATEENSE